MPQNSEIKKHIRSIREIKQITRAMQLVSQVKMKRSRKLLDLTKPFFLGCVRTMEEMMIAEPEALSNLFQIKQKPAGSEWKVLFFVFGAEQGLSGSYSLNVVRFAEKVINDTKARIEKDGYVFSYEIRFLGKIGRERLVRDGYQVNASWNCHIDNPNFYDATDIANNMFDLYHENKVDSIYLVYSTMKNKIQAHPIYTRLMPADYQGLHLLLSELFSQAEIEEEEQRCNFYQHETMEWIPNAHKVKDYLSLTYIYGMVYGAFTESFASEQAVRMTAMNQATDNADELLGKLQIEKNRVRQQQITQELNEIISGSIL